MRGCVLKKHMDLFDNCCRYHRQRNLLCLCQSVWNLWISCSHFLPPTTRYSPTCRKNCNKSGWTGCHIAGNWSSFNFQLLITYLNSFCFCFCFCYCYCFYCVRDETVRGETANEFLSLLHDSCSGDVIPPKLVDSISWLPSVVLRKKAIQVCKASWRICPLSVPLYFACLLLLPALLCFVQYLCHWHWL